MTQIELGRIIVFHLKRAEVAYKNYLGYDKKYIYAKNIKKANDCVQRVIIEYNHLLPKSLEEDIIQLLEHLEIWTERWVDLENKQSPDLDDEFIFQNKHQFPRNACQNIINHFENNIK